MSDIYEKVYASKDQLVLTVFQADTWYRLEPDVPPELAKKGVGVFGEPLVNLKVPPKTSTGKEDRRTKEYKAYKAWDDQWGEKYLKYYMDYWSNHGFSQNVGTLKTNKNTKDN